VIILVDYPRENSHYIFVEIMKLSDRLEQLGIDEIREFEYFVVSK